MVWQVLVGAGSATALEDPSEEPREPQPTKTAEPAKIAKNARMKLLQNKTGITTTAHNPLKSLEKPARVET